MNWPTIWTLLIGAGLSAIPTIAVTVIRASSERRRQIRELAVRMGVDEWKAHVDYARKKAALVCGPDTYVLPSLIAYEGLLELKKVDAAQNA